MLCSQLHCQQVFNQEAVSYQIVSLVAARERVWVVDVAGALYVVPGSDTKRLFDENFVMMNFTTHVL